MEFEQMGRRTFAAHLALGAAAAYSASTAGDDSTDDKAKASPPSEPTPPQNAATLLAAIIARDYPNERLDAETLAAIEQDIESDRRKSRELSDFPLKNSDEPAFAFRAYRGDDGPCRCNT